MAKRTGIDAATRRAMAPAAERGGGDPDQPALFPDAVEPERAPGRPAGAPSKRTRDFLNYLDAMPELEMPGIWLAKRYSRDVPAILADCGLADTDENRRWADGQRQDAAKALAPYVHERRPQAVQVDDRRTISVSVTAFDADGGEILDLAGDGGELSLTRLLLPHERADDGDE